MCSEWECFDVQRIMFYMYSVPQRLQTTHVIQPVSLMPDNLHQLMTTQELVDLVEYMSTLRRKPGTGKKDQ